MAEQPPIDIRADHWQIVRGILQRHVPHCEVWAFGSRVKWTAKPHSDLDLAVIADQPLPLAISAALADDFSESDLPWRVDVVDWATTSESFRQIIERDKVVVQKAEPIGLQGRGMGTEWRSGKLGDFVELKRGYDLPQAKRKRGAVPLVSSSGISDSHDVAMVKGPGVVTGRYGTIGQVFYIENDFWPLNTTLYIRDFKGNDRKFIHYFLKTLDFHAYSDKAAVPGVNRNHLHEAVVTVPPVSVQREIAAFLGSLDDRITLLGETNATLEAIAQALFKSWFVDFDPVRAKMEGRAPEGLDEATAALFPDSFEETELGAVPRGWAVRSLDEIATYLNGLALQKFPPTGQDDLPVIKIAQLRKGDTVGADMASRAIKPGYIIQNGDVLFSWSGSLEVEVWCGGEGALNQHLFKVTSDKFPKWFYFLWTRHHLEHFRQVAASKATTMGHIQRAHLTAAKVIVPSNDVIRMADVVIAPILQRMIENALQAQTLAALRDTLLPRLISGQLRLPEARTLIDAVA